VFLIWIWLFGQQSSQIGFPVKTGHVKTTPLHEL